MVSLELRCLEMVTSAVNLADSVQFEYDEDNDCLFDIFVMKKSKCINIFAYKDGHFEDRDHNQLDDPEAHLYEFLGV